METLGRDEGRCYRDTAGGLVDTGQIQRRFRWFKENRLSQRMRK